MADSLFPLPTLLLFGGGSGASSWVGREKMYAGFRYISLRSLYRGIFLPGGHSRRGQLCCCLLHRPTFQLLCFQMSWFDKLSCF